MRKILLMAAVTVSAIFCAFVLVPTLTASAATYTITSDSQYQTIQNAVAGDTVLIAKGTYHTGITLRKTGTASAPITIKAQDSTNRPIFDYSGYSTIPNQPSLGKACWEFGGDSAGNTAYYVIDGIIITNCPLGDGGGGGGIGYYYNANNLTFRNILVKDSNASGIKAGSASANQHDILVENSEFSGNNRAGGDQNHGLYIAGGHGFIMRYSYIHDTQGAGQNLHMRDTNSVIEYNWFANAGGYEFDLMNGYANPSGTNYNMLVRGNVFIPSTTTGVQKLGLIDNDGSGPSAHNNLTMAWNTIYATFTLPKGIVDINNASGLNLSANVIFSNNIVSGTLQKVIYQNMSTPVPTLSGTNNWLYTGSTVAVGSLANTINGTNPGFTNTGTQDFSLVSSSPVIGKAITGLTCFSLPCDPTSQYVKNSLGASRPSANDLGAFSYSGIPLPTYPLSTSVSPAGAGTVSPANGNYSGTISLQATQAPGYTFSSWAGSLTGSTNPINLTMDGTKTVTANFTLNPPPPSTSLSASPTSVTSGGSSTLTWSSTNASSCTASGGWTGTKATSGSQAVSPTVTSTYTLTCTGTGGSATQSTTVSVTSTPLPTASLSANPTSITSGQSSTLTWSSSNTSSCTASNGWTGTKATSGSQAVSPTVTSTYTLTCTGTGGSATQSTTVSVTSTTNKFVVRDRVYVNTDGTNVRPAPVNGTIGDAIGTQALNVMGTILSGPVVATPKGGSALNWWSVNYDTGTDGWTYEGLLTKVATYTLTTSVSPAGGGTVTKNPNQASYPSGTVVTLTAAPASGYTFSSWSGSVTGTANSVSVTMNGNKTVTATFSPIFLPTYTLSTTVSPAGGGTVSPTSGIYDSGTLVSVQAYPASGYTFSSWSNGATGSTNPVSVTMDATKTVTANFTQTPPPPPPPTGSWPLVIGSRVQVTAKTLKVRSSANGAQVGNQTVGAVGTIGDGPIVAGGSTWWNINYDVAPSGWSSQDYLKPYGCKDGDANCDGKINSLDYAAIDNGFKNKLTGWANGDFNGDGKINFDDYYIINTAFLNQGSSGSGGSVSLSFSLFSSTQAPVVVDDEENRASEVGVKFKSDVAGTVTGIRFYKGPKNTGTHTGHLWDRNGNLLASATFTGETASGWQQVNFSQSVTIQPNTTYVASYFAPVGQYAEDDNVLTNAGIDATPLHALKSGVDGVNGVYKVTDTSAFPTETWLNANYWVDVIFMPQTTAFRSYSGKDQIGSALESIKNVLLQFLR